MGAARGPLAGGRRWLAAALSTGVVLTGAQAVGGDDRTNDLAPRVVALDARVVPLDDRVVALDPRVVPLVTDTPAGTTVEVGADILFAFDSADLSPEGAGQLDGVVALLRSSGASAVQVAGHTDSVGDAAYNLDLSQRRAEAVAAALRAALANPGVAITTEGFGETRPVADDREGKDPGAALRNRRVTITF